LALKGRDRHLIFVEIAKIIKNQLTLLQIAEAVVNFTADFCARFRIALGGKYTGDCTLEKLFFNRGGSFSAKI
jgi:hypothetical protein